MSDLSSDFLVPTIIHVENYRYAADLWSHGRAIKFILCLSDEGFGLTSSSNFVSAELPNRFPQDVFGDRRCAIELAVSISDFLGKPSAYLDGVTAKIDNSISVRVFQAVVGAAYEPLDRSPYHVRFKSHKQWLYYQG